jgi:hypothetical protein
MLTKPGFVNSKGRNAMSYDMEIADEQFSYTWNVAPMWYAAMPEKGIQAHCGMTGRDALVPLRRIREYMEDNRDAMIAMNPDNGWGDYDGALQFVTDLINASARNPETIWYGA